jgi:hypothetical protein
MASGGSEDHEGHQGKQPEASLVCEEITASSPGVTLKFLFDFQATILKLHHEGHHLISFILATMPVTY